MKVCILINNHHPRAKRVGNALAAGCESMGWSPTVSTFYLGCFDQSQSFDLVTGYGWCNEEIFESYRKRGTKYIYIDLGYWRRKLYRSDYNGFHKCVLNARHPVSYFQRNRDGRRITDDTPWIQPWKKGQHIVLAGMSGKGALSVGKQPMYWERSIVDKLRRITKRPIVYRPKPSWKAFTEIHGTTLSLDPQPISDILTNAHALVTYYSNASIDALAAGVPIYTVDGIAKPFSIDSIDNIEDIEKYKTCDRQQFLNDISYCHFTKDEIESGYMFRQFVEDGLL